MPAPHPLYHEIQVQIATVTASLAPPAYSVDRLALLVTGILAAQSSVVAQVAVALDALALTAATRLDSIERRLRRTRNDPHLTPGRCYAPVLTTVVAWDELRAAQGRAVLIIDESTKTDEVHLFRVSLAYRGSAIPLAWTVWPQNEALGDGVYWQRVDTVLAQVQALLPPDLTVSVVADCAYAIPTLLDRLTARGWHWVLRVQTGGSHRFRDGQGTEQALAQLVATHLPRPGTRWHTTGWVFKDAGWRAVSVVGIWAIGTEKPLVVLTDLPPRFSVLRLYDRRSWIEPSFRSDKAKGWQWEACQIHGVAHHVVLLVGLAWATLLTLCLGVADATAHLQRLLQRQPHRGQGLGKPQHARHSLFTLGLHALRGWFFGTRPGHLTWWLPGLAAPAWTAEWTQAQAHRFLFGSPVRP